MPVKTFQSNPTSFAEFMATRGSIEIALGPDIQNQSTGTSVTLQRAVFFGVPLVAQGLLRFDFGVAAGDIPAGQLITDAYFRLFSAGINTVGLNVDVGLLARDGRWDGVGHPGTPWHPPGAETADMQVTVCAFPGFSAQIGPTWSGTSTLSWPYKQQIIESYDTLGQTVLATSDFTLGRADIRLKRGSVAKTASVWVVVFLANPDGTPNVGAGIQATSDTLTFNSISQASTGSTAAFSFTGANRIAITSGTSYVFTVRDDSAPSGPLQAMNAIYRVGNPYASGTMHFGSVGSAFHEAFSLPHYPQRRQLPYLYENGLTTVHGPLFGLGAIVNGDVPNFDADNTWYTFRPNGLKYLIQEWRDSGSYVAGNVIGFTLSSTVASALGTRVFDDVELVVEYRDRQVYVG